MDLLILGVSFFKHSHLSEPASIFEKYTVRFQIILWPFCHSIQWRDVRNFKVGGSLWNGWLYFSDGLELFTLLDRMFKQGLWVITSY